MASLGSFKKGIVSVKGGLGQTGISTPTSTGGGGIAPVISGVPTISSQTEVGETITATPASATGTPTPTTSWQWQRSSDGVTGWANIIGATSSTYTLVIADDTKYVRVVQTETNTSGSDSANSASSGQVSSYDADAAAYFTAASITDATEKDAANQLVLDLKGTGSTTNNSDVWSDMSALYPVSPTSLAAAAFNLKDPTAYEITWVNAPTHSDVGVAFNGTTQYGDMGFAPSALFNSVTDGTIGGAFDHSGSGVDYIMGVTQATTQRFFMFYNSGDLATQLFKTGASSTSFSYTTRNRQFTTTRRGDTDLETYEDGVSKATEATSQSTASLPTINPFVGAFNSAGTPAGYSALTVSSLFAGNSLTDNQVTDLYDAIAKYNQTVLVLDADAKTYIDDAGITNRTEIAAVNQLVLDLKGTGSTTNNNNIWASMNAIYPVSPTSLAAAAYNLKDSATFPITWANSPTHASTGIKGGGTSYGDTGYDANSEGMSNNDFGITYSGVYSGGDYAMGVLGGGVYFAIRNTSNNKIFYGGSSSNPALGGDATRSVTTAIRSSNISREIFKNGVSNGTNTTSDTGTLPALNIYVLALNNSGSPAGSFAKETDFYAVHTALTDGEVVDLYDAITTYNANVISGGR